MAEPAYPWLEAARERYRRIAAEPLPANILALLREAAADSGEAEALRFIEGGGSHSYAELLDGVERLAHGLRGLGVGRGSHVAVMAPNVVETPTTWLALAAIGAVMIPVNVRYTAFELDYLLTDGEASHLVLHESFAPLLDEIAGTVAGLRAVVVIGDDPALPDGRVRWRDLVARSPAGFSPEIEPGLDDVVNVQYTSGTTGWPKGCLLTQRYWLTCAKAYAASDGLRYRRILSPNPFFYMTPQWLMLMAFFQRATLVVAPYLSLTRFTDWVREHEVEFCWFPMDAMARRPREEDFGPLALKRANLAIHRPELHREIEERYGFPARSAFGMTEIGVGLMTPIEAAEFVGSGSCGMAGPFREARIADPEGNDVPDGARGELLIRGPGLFLGYYRKPEATRAAFHGDWFRTGDLASRDADGFVTIHGRIKEMIRRSGENISATEVEAALLLVPGVAEAAVIPVPDPLRGEEVKAYVVLEPGRTRTDVPPEAIVAHCGRRLAAFKTPRFIEYRDAPLPRSTSGKVRKPDLAQERDDLRAGSWDHALGTWL